MILVSESVTFSFRIRELLVSELGNFSFQSGELLVADSGILVSESGFVPYAVPQGQQAYKVVQFSSLHDLENGDPLVYKTMSCKQSGPLITSDAPSQGFPTTIHGGSCVGRSRVRVKGLGFRVHLNLPV